MNKEYVDAYISRGIAYSALAKHDEAIKDYEEAIRIDPQNANSFYALSFTLALQKGKMKEVIEAYKEAEKLYREQGKREYSQSAGNKIEELQTQQAP
jgi:tetratricopeptide (TPR) repeat protein